MCLVDCVEGDDQEVRTKEVGNRDDFVQCSPLWIFSWTDYLGPFFEFKKHR